MYVFVYVCILCMYVCMCVCVCVCVCMYCYEHLTPPGGHKHYKASCRLVGFEVRACSICGLAVTAGIAMKFGMADRDRVLVVRKALAPMAEKGFPRPPVILVLLSKN